MLTLSTLALSGTRRAVSGRDLQLVGLVAILRPCPPLRSSRTSSTSILRNVADGITAQRADGSLAYANDAAARLLGLSSGDELIGLQGTELTRRFVMHRRGRGSRWPRTAPEPARARLRAARAGDRRLSAAPGRGRTLVALPLDADPDESGSVDLVINVIHDVTAERRARARAQLLDETGAVFAASIDIDATFDALAALLVPRLADYCIVDMVEDGRLRQVVIAHRNPEHEQLLRELRERYPPTANAAHPVSEVLATGEPYLVEDARVEALSHAAVDEEHLALYRRLEAMSYIVVPLEARGRMLGTISLGTGESGRRFGELDLSLARELARRAALAIDNALLFGAAQQSYAQLNTLLVSAPVGIGFWDRDLRFVRVNDALATINGLSPEEHVGRYLGDVIGELAPILVPLYRRVLETGEPVVHTESTDDAALQMGERRHWLSSYYPVHTPEGEVIGIGAVIMEITDRKRADDRLRLLAEAGELFSTSLDQDEIASRIAHVGVPRLADTCNVYLLRDGVLARVACVAADPAAQPVLESLPADLRALRRSGTDRERVQELRAAAAAHAPGRLSGRARAVRRRTRGDRADRDTLVDARTDRRPRTGRSAFSRSGRGAPIVSMSTISTSRRSWPAAPASRWTTRGSSASCGAARRRRRRSSSSATASSSSAARATSCSGTRPPRASPGLPRRRSSARSPRRAGRLAARPGRAAADVPGRGPHGELWLSLSAAEFPHGTVYAFRDLTEERAVEQLKSDFVSTVSHELRTPLAAIYGAAMTLQRADVELNDVQEAGMLDVISGESERLARIVNDILLASRLDSGAATVEISRTDAGELARAVLAAAEAHLPPGVELALSVPDPGPQVAADPDGLRQVLVNLVENAVKYSPGRRPRRAPARADGRPRPLRRARPRARHPASEHERIFEKFFRLDPNLARGVGGTGLGLYISREIVRRMGGRIRVESEPGRGSTFSFELPLA